MRENEKRSKGKTQLTHRSQSLCRADLPHPSLVHARPAPPDWPKQGACGSGKATLPGSISALNSEGSRPKAGSDQDDTQAGPGRRKQVLSTRSANPALGSPASQRVPAWGGGRLHWATRGCHFAQRLDQVASRKALKATQGRAGQKPPKHTRERTCQEGTPTTRTSSPGGSLEFLNAFTATLLCQRRPGGLGCPLRSG